MVSISELSPDEDTDGVGKGGGATSDGSRPSSTSGGSGSDVSIPYSAKFSRGKIFVDWSSETFRGNFVDQGFLIATPIRC